MLPRQVFREGRYNAYVVKIRLTENRRTIFNREKMFSDRKHGTHEAALDAAIAWRDEINTRLGRIKTERQGLPRVNRVKYGKHGHLFAWRVRWIEYPGGPRKMRQYGEIKYGADVAEALAWEKWEQVFAQFY